MFSWNLSLSDQSSCCALQWGDIEQIPEGGAAHETTGLTSVTSQCLTAQCHTANEGIHTMWPVIQRDVTRPEKEWNTRDDMRESWKHYAERNEPVTVKHRKYCVVHSCEPARAGLCRDRTWTVVAAAHVCDCTKTWWIVLCQSVRYIVWEFSPNTAVTLKNSGVFTKRKRDGKHCSRLKLRHSDQIHDPWLDSTKTKEICICAAEYQKVRSLPIWAWLGDCPCSPRRVLQRFWVKRYTWSGVALKFGKKTTVKTKV